MARLVADLLAVVLVIPSALLEVEAQAAPEELVRVGNLRRRLRLAKARAPHDHRIAGLRALELERLEVGEFDSGRSYLALKIWCVHSIARAF